MSFYDEMSAIATELLVEFGQSMMLRRRTAGTYNPAVGSATLVLTDVTVNGVIFDEPDRNDAGTMVVKSTKKVLLSVFNTSPPNVNDTLTVNGQAYTVQSVETLAPAGINVIYKLYVS
jgi:hypothetical protein